MNKPLPMPARALSTDTENLHALAGRLQAQLHAGEAHLQRGDAQAYQRACEDLSGLMAELAALCGRLPRAVLQDAAQASVLRALRSLLAQQREGLARRAGLVDRALKVYLPSQVPAVYGRAGAGYLQHARQTGALASLRA